MNLPITGSTTKDSSGGGVLTTGQVKGCCAPSRQTHLPEPAHDGTAHSSRRAGQKLHHDIEIPGGTFSMGDAFGEGYPADGETPVHKVRLDGFRIDATAVTNSMFGAFVQATGYRTEAEQYCSSAVFHLLSTASSAAILGAAAGAPWWLDIRGADWAHPTGPNSTWHDTPDHPVVHISHNDALAYCDWAGRRLPSEAQWEYAARGGLAGMRYAWGNELTPDGEHRCNIWQGTFPTTNTRDDGHLGTAPVRSFPPNGYGLYEMAGNVWEWCADWFLPKYYRNSPADNPQGPTIGAGRVMRGGSYLCHDSYCNRYRVAARTSNTPESSSGNLGFRTIVFT
ncbi:MULTISPECIES: formylglycine-generating enzyme family protein [unclassified Arthrobacter]|uniref:formylglycine-generating enzyme family protein n=1 Tax=unclassified Arthrobacter TaxID=235627 RepID=UPI001F31B7CB|nr:formylglycine-generating enzyme family protein [Arthrobacter sp. FW305-BF8]UKA56156.1 formylglycine-generating enzyme family protein [Arthrobacter sp. FW305-BF8]